MPPKALADLDQTSKLFPKDPYLAQWLDIVNKRSNPASRLPQATAQLDMGSKWPAPIIRLFLGQSTQEGVLAVADVPDATKKRRGSYTLNAGHFAARPI